MSREHSLTPAERPAARRGVVRRARLIFGGDRIVVRLPHAVHEWPVGDTGVASAAHSKNPCPLAGVRERGGQEYWQQAAVQRIEDSGGCLHLCDVTGASLVCLLPNDWVPDGVAPKPLGRAGQPARGADLKPDDYLRTAGITELLAAHGIPVRERAEPPNWAEGAAGTLRPGPYEVGTWKMSCASWGFFLAGIATLFIGFVISRARDDSTPLIAACAGFAALLLLLGVATLALPAWRAVLVPLPDRPSAALRPSPGVPVTRGFLRRSRFVRYGDELMLRDAHGVERWLRGPGDSVTGVQEALMLTSAGEQWAVALVDKRETVLALLAWDTWFAGDGGAQRLADFCEAAGISLRERPGRNRPRGFRDAEAEAWNSRDYGRNSGRFAQLTFCAVYGTFAAVLLLTGMRLGAPVVVALSAAATVVNIVAPVSRFLLRRFRLNHYVRPSTPVPAGRDTLSPSTKRK